RRDEDRRHGRRGGDPAPEGTGGAGGDPLAGADRGPLELPGLGPAAREQAAGRVEGYREGRGAAMPTFSLCNADSGARCDIELGRGLSYLVSVRTHGELDALTAQLLELPATRMVDNVGGLINNINILENIALPVLYHGMTPVAEIEKLILEAFAD